MSWTHLMSNLTSGSLLLTFIVSCSVVDWFGCVCCETSQWKSDFLIWWCTSERAGACTSCTRPSVDNMNGEMPLCTDMWFFCMWLATEWVCFQFFKRKKTFASKMCTYSPRLGPSQLVSFPINLDTLVVQVTSAASAASLIRIINMEYETFCGDFHHGKHFVGPSPQNVLGKCAHKMLSWDFGHHNIFIWKNALWCNLGVPTVWFLKKHLVGDIGTTNCVLMNILRIISRVTTIGFVENKIVDLFSRYHKV